MATRQEVPGPASRWLVPRVRTNNNCQTRKICWHTTPARPSLLSCIASEGGGRVKLKSPKYFAILCYPFPYSKIDSKAEFDRRNLIIRPSASLTEFIIPPPHPSVREMVEGSSRGKIWLKKMDGCSRSAGVGLQHSRTCSVGVVHGCTGRGGGEGTERKCNVQPDTARCCRGCCVERIQRKCGKVKVKVLE